MTKFLLSVWSLAKPYRLRLFLGVLTGILSGLMQPLLIGTIVFVYSAVFQSAQASATQSLVSRLPAFVQTWFANVRTALETGVRGIPGQ